MDIGSIISNALGGLIGGLALLLLLEAGKRIRSAIKQRAAKPKEVLDQSLRESQEYQQILRNRQSYRMIGYICLAAFIIFLAAAIAVGIQIRKIDIKIEWIGFLLLLFCEIPLAFYVGYSPISSHEVERKRQQNRERIFKEAHGAKPYGYIVWSIIFPIILSLYIGICIVGLIWFFADPPSIMHLSLLWRVLGVGFTILCGLWCIYVVTRSVYTAVKYLKYIPRQQQQQLQKEFLQDEFRQ